MPKSNHPKAAPPGKGVRHLSLNDQLPNCEISINKSIYKLSNTVSNCQVIDIGCGFGRNRPTVEAVGGTWTGVEPFDGGAHTVTASADDLPFENSSFDVAIMDAVLEHLPNVEKSFAEVARVLRPNGVFVGYVAFMECFHEISYSHLSFKALEYYAEKNNMKLVKLSGGSRFGIDYHTAVLLYPLPFNWGRALIASMIRLLIRIKAFLAYFALRLGKGRKHSEARQWSVNYFKLECLRQSNGFQFVIKKNG